MENPFASSEAPVAPVRTSSAGLWILAVAAALERFGHFGVRTVLVLFLIDQAQGGPGWDRDSALAAATWSGAAGSFALVFGALFADVAIGARRAAIAGPFLMALGALTFLVPSTLLPALGLALLVVGSGLFRPAAHAIAGALMTRDDPRREAVFTLAWLPVNAGAFAGPIVCGLLSDTFGWSAAFVASAAALLTAGALLAATRPALTPAPLQPAVVEGPGLGALVLALAAFSLLKSALGPLGPNAGAASMFFALPLSVFVALTWTRLRKRGAGPSAPQTLGLAMIAVVAGDLITDTSGSPESLAVAPLAGAALVALGDLCLGPIVLTEVTRRPPARFSTTLVALAIVVSSLPFVPNLTPTIAESLGTPAALSARILLLIPAAALVLTQRRR